MLIIKNKEFGFFLMEGEMKGRNLKSWYRSFNYCQTEPKCGLGQILAEARVVRHLQA